MLAGFFTGLFILNPMSYQFKEAIFLQNKEGQKILIHDDLLATGGTASAAAELVKHHNADVLAFTFLIELSFLKGKEKLLPYTPNIICLTRY